MNTLRETGEDALITRLLRHAPLLETPHVGPGDDCAVIDQVGDSLLLLKTDTIVEGVHFTPDTSPLRVGWKAAARVVSDIAAMGGVPAEFLAAIALDPATPTAWAEGLYQGIGDCLRLHGACLAGGETSSVPAGAPAVITISATGSVRRESLVLRSGGRPGDLLMVTGTLGGSLAGKHLDFAPRLAESHWLVAHHKPTAMMDLSDGIARDLPRLASASGCGFFLRESTMPVTAGRSLAQALRDGEDYELLFSLHPAELSDLLDEWPMRFPDTPLSLIGALTHPGEGDFLDGGWDHFIR